MIFSIYTYTLCSPECLVLSLVYIDRLIQSQTVVVNSLSIHRVLITRFWYCLCLIVSIMIAALMILSLRTSSMLVWVELTLVN